MQRQRAAAQCPGRAAHRRRSTGAPAHAAAPAADARRGCRFEKPWRKWLHDGFIAGIGGGRRRPRPSRRMWRRASAGRRAPIDGIEVNFRRDPTIYDGRFANNGWLQELPKPMTKLTWDNAALIAPATAERST